MQDGDQLPCLNDYPSQSVSLLASRHRMHCESSQKSSEPSQTNEHEMEEFKQQIEDRFHLSIANKIYTFPKVIDTIYDILSSSEDEPEDCSTSKNTHANKQDKSIHKLFKKKSFGKTTDSKRKQDLSSSNHYLNAEPQQLNSSSKAKTKLKSRKSTKKTEMSSKSKEKMSLKMNKTTAHNRQTTKADRIKTQPEPDILISTIRAKLLKKH